MATATRSSHLAFSAAFRRIFKVLLTLLLLSRVDAQTNAGEVETLLQIKAGSVADSSAIGTGYFATWKTNDTTPCNWWGVTCTLNNTVEKLSLSAWGLVYLPSFTLLSNLSDLRELDLSHNNFISDVADPITIPDDIGSLTALTSLSLMQNGFGGPVPANISACQNLRYLNLDGNTLSEIPDLSGLKNLQYLYLPSNLLSGQFPIWVGKLERLQVINLSTNMFNGTIPSIPGLTNLIEIMLDNNNFIGFEEPIFPGATSLVHLDAHMNQLQGPVPASLTNLVRLGDLDLSYNQFSGPIPTNFSLDMSNAVSFKLHQNNLTGTIPRNLLQPTRKRGSGSKLPTLMLSDNFLTGSIPFDGTKQYHYQRIDFGNNSLSGPIPSFCDNGSSFISQLWLANNQLEGDIVDFFANCFTCIQDLALGNNSFSGDLSAIVANLSSSSIDMITKTSVLTGIDFTNNNLQMSVSEATPDPLTALLEYFVLNKKVKRVLMKGNKFSGTPLPTSLSSPASFLTYLDLSNNSLRGEISGEAFNSTWFPALQNLYLSDNHLTGPIPQALVLLPNLQVLNVINNSLSGALPAILPGQINPNYFAGNPGLCGYPLQGCSQRGSVKWWVLLIVISGSVAVVVASCLALTWRWRKYQKLHQQDADLIKTLLDRESASLMSLRELKRATSNFADGAEIGKGGFGTVYKGNLIDGTLVAIKRLTRYEGVEKDKHQFLNEVRILSQVSHRHLVKLLGCCMEGKTALLVFEFVSNGTLQEHLQGKFGGKRLSWKQRLSIAIQTADALNYLHTAASFPIYHRDVKAANILLDTHLNAKVADFGISRLAPAQEATHVSTLAIKGTVGYMDPEYYTSYQLTDKSDVYSFGVVLLELMSAKPAIDFQRGGDETGLVYFVNRHMKSGDMREVLDVAILETYDEKVGRGRQSIENMGRLAMQCLQGKSKARPSMREVWKELQNMWLELEGTSRELTRTCSEAAASESDKFKEIQYDDIILLADSFSGNSSSFTLPSDGSMSVQLSQFSLDSGTRSK